MPRGGWWQLGYWGMNRKDAPNWLRQEDVLLKLRLQMLGKAWRVANWASVCCKTENMCECLSTRTQCYRSHSTISRKNGNYLSNNLTTRRHNIRMESMGGGEGYDVIWPREGEASRDKQHITKHNIWYVWWCKQRQGSDVPNSMGIMVNRGIEINMK